MSEPRIRIVHESQASGETRELYDEIQGFMGLPFVPDIMKVVSTRPDFLRNFFEMYKSMFGGGHLPRPVKEMIATVVSQANSCSY